MEGETGGVRTVLVSLYNNGQPYYISDVQNTEAYVSGTKSDGTYADEKCVIVDSNTIQFNITDQMQAIHGQGEYSIKLVDITTDSCVKSFPFVIRIEKTSENIKIIVSSNEFKVLTHLISDADKAIKNANDAAKYCMEKANNILNENIVFDDYTESEVTFSLKDAVSKIVSGSKLAVLWQYCKASFLKIIDEIDVLKKKIGSNDISSMGDGSLTGAISYLKENNVFERSLTLEEYNSLSEAEKNNGTEYFIIDSDQSILTASNIKMTNSNDSLTVKQRIDDISQEVNIQNGKLNIKTVNISEGITAFYNDYFVTIKITTTETVFPSNSWNALGVIPEALRPSETLYFPLMNYNSESQNSNTTIIGSVNTNGNLSIYTYSDVTKLTPYSTITYAL